MRKLIIVGLFLLSAIFLAAPVISAGNLSPIVPPPPATQDEAEAGTEPGLRWFSPLRIAQEIAALAETDPGAWGTSTEVTISDGVAALTGTGYYTVDTEGDAETDDLTQITGLTIGDEVIIAAENTDRTIEIKAGDYFYIEADFTLDNTRDRIKLQCIGSDICVQLSRSNGGD